MTVGIVGTGGMGRVHARHYRALGVDLVAWDRDTAKLETFAAENGARVAGSFGELLASSDLADICLPTHRHYSFVLEALESKTAVLVEKPMGRTLDECRGMVRAASSAGVPLGVAHVVRYFPEHRRAHELVVSGAVGTPAAVRMRRGGRAPVGSEGWFQDAEKSGGVILDLAIHDFDWLRWTLGECVQVYARSVRMGEVVRAAEFVGDYALCTLSFEGGAVAHVEATWMDPSGFRTTLEVAGSGGLIEFDSRSEPVVRTHTEGASRSESPMAGGDDPYYLQLKGVLEALESGVAMPVSGEEGLKAVGIALAALESAATGRPVTPARE